MFDSVDTPPPHPVHYSRHAGPVYFIDNIIILRFLRVNTRDDDRSTRARVSFYIRLGILRDFVDFFPSLEILVQDIRDVRGAFRAKNPIRKSRILKLRILFIIFFFHFFSRLRGIFNIFHVRIAPFLSERSTHAFISVVFFFIPREFSFF